MRLEQYLIEADISFDDYCQGIDAYMGLNEGILSRGADVVKRVFNMAKSEFEAIASEMGEEVDTLMQSFKNNAIYGMLKSLGFSLKHILKAIRAFTNLIRDGLLEVFKEIHDTKLFKKIHSGAVKVDELFEKYPILKRVVGPAVAGLLFYIWLNMTFIGSLEYDFDFSDMAAALSGNFSLADLFASPSGLMLITLLGTGGLISAPWLGKTTYNLILALVFTGLKMSKESDKPLIKKIKNKIPTVKV